MGEGSLAHAPDTEAGPDYRVRVMLEARVTDRGVEYEDEGRSELLDWSRVTRAIAAEVGEPEGVRTIVFDLILERDGGGWLAYRLDADPGEDAMKVARAIEVGLGRDRPMASIKSVATDGIPTRWYPDLGAFEEAALEIVRFG